jgi:hypothetical protein
MKKTLVTGLALACFGIAGSALAFQPTFKNEDSKSYKYEVQCGGSTTHSSISANTSTTLSSGNGNCTLKVEGAGSAKLKDDLKCVIKAGSLSCK